MFYFFLLILMRQLSIFARSPLCFWIELALVYLFSQATPTLNRIPTDLQFLADFALALAVG